MVLLKFQKENRLAPIKQGVFHFRPTNSYRIDPTSFRGDPMEGKAFGDPSGSFQIDGFEISQWIEEIVWSKEYEGNILSISFFQLNMNNCHEVEDGLFTLNENAIKMMQQFGDSFIAINPFQFISSIETALSGLKCNYEFHPIHYCDIKDYNAVRQFFRRMHDANSLYSEFFLKDESQYGFQNEWRFLIHDQDNELPLEENGGVNIHTGFRTEIPIFKTEDIETLRVSKDLLF